jgi:endonuclease YncB( thermonuclease family)
VYKKFTLDGLREKGRLLSVYDGDTFIAGISFMNDNFQFKFRISNIDTPEIKTDFDNAMQSRNKFLQLCGLNIDLHSKLTKKEIETLLKDNIIEVDIHCKKHEKYGRILCDVFKNNIDVGQTLIEEKYAKSY